jgi:DNA-binding MarR family transcriptional regulator
MMAYMTNHYLGPVYKRIEVELGLTSPEFLSLMCVTLAPGINAIDISRVSGRPRNSVSRAVAALIRKDLLTVEPDRSDGRRKSLAATPAGRRLYRRIEPMFEARHTAMLAVLDPSGRAALDKLLRRLAFRPDGWAAAY